MAVATLTFGDRVAAEVERKRSQLVVGLDPRPDLLPVELRGDVTRFCCGIVDAVAPHAVAVKPQLAFFEALGPPGMVAFAETCAYARRAGLLVIADGKRGDVGSTARAYAAAYLEGDEPLADALTVNPWLGRESIEPYLAAARRYGAGIFCVVKTSNAGGEVQDLTLSDGRPVWQHVAALVAEWGADLVGERGLSSVGAVVGRHPSARGQRGAQADAAGDHAAARRRRAGREAGRPRARVHERPGERARQRLSLDQLRLPRARATTSGRRQEPRPRGCSSEIWTVSGW